MFFLAQESDLKALTLKRINLYEKRFQTSDSRIGEKHPCFIIAEIAQAHDGSLGTAHAYIDAVRKNRCLMQSSSKRILQMPNQVPMRNSGSTASLRMPHASIIGRRMEFSKTQWRDLAAHASDKGLSISIKLLFRWRL